MDRPNQVSFDGQEGRPVRVAITLGDPGGIGPEVALKSVLSDEFEGRPLLVGSAEVLRGHARRLGFGSLMIQSVQSMPASFPEEGLVVLDVTDGAAPDWHFGQATAAGGRLSMQAVERAIDLCRDGAVDAMVTAPISKEAIAGAGYEAPGHTEFIAERTQAGPHAMMMVAEEMRVGLVTGHCPLAEVPARITPEAVQEKIRILGASLRKDFGIEQPRLAVLGLNPHAGDKGVLGREELEVIEPALREMHTSSVRVDGPFPADGFFGLSKHQSYDAVLAMYHDQGLVPFKALTFERGVNYTAGLPIVRTSPDHGTAYDIAGEGMAVPGSMQRALELAASIARRRAGQGAGALSET